MTPETKKALVDDYEGFLRVGRVSSEEWATLDDDEKACLLLAQRRIDVENAILKLDPLGDPLGVAVLMSSLDGGEMLMNLRARQVVDAAVARYEARGEAA